MDRLLNKFLIATILLTFLGSCIETKYNQNIKSIRNSSSISELFQLAYELRDDTLFSKVSKLINDTIKKERNFYCLSSIMSINEEKKTVEWDFIPCDRNSLRLSDEYFFNLSIKHIDTILIEGELQKEKRITKLLENYISKPDSICNCYRTNVIDYFGEVEQPAIGIMIEIKANDEHGLTEKQWEVFFRCFDKLISYYKNKKQDYSKKEWGVDYKSLSIDKKIAITGLANFNMLIIFDL